jgi:hypothetical protein
MMAAPEAGDRASLWPVLLAAVGVAACCAGPVLVALVATGIGAAVVRSGSAVLGTAAATALVIAGLVWWRRRSCACPAPPSTQHPRESRVPGEGTSPERREPTHVR